MARVPPTRHVDHLTALNSELDRLRQQIDAARCAAFDRRKAPDRRAHSRQTPDRRVVAEER